MTKHNGDWDEDEGDVRNQFGSGNREKNKNEEDPQQQETLFWPLKEGHPFFFAISQGSQEKRRPWQGSQYDDGDIRQHAVASMGLLCEVPKEMFLDEEKP